MTESVVLSLAGGVAGLLLSVGLVRAVIAWGPALPRLQEATLSGTILLFVAGVSVVTGVLVFTLK